MLPKAVWQAKISLNYPTACCSIGFSPVYFFKSLTWHHGPDALIMFTFFVQSMLSFIQNIINKLCNFTCGAHFDVLKIIFASYFVNGPPIVVRLEP